MTAAEALLKAEERILLHRQAALDKAEAETDFIGKHTWDITALAHKADAEVCRILRESLKEEAL